MTLFMITWWDASQIRYHNEYFRTARGMFDRFQMIYSDIPDSNPEIQTLHTED